MAPSNLSHFLNSSRYLLLTLMPILKNVVSSMMKQKLDRDLQNVHSAALTQEHLETSGSEQQPSNSAPLFSGAQRLESDQLESIAVIGFAARLPQDATTAEAFW